MEGSRGSRSSTSLNECQFLLFKQPTADPEILMLSSSAMSRDRFLRRQEVEAVIGYCKASIYRLIAAGEFRLRSPSQFARFVGASRTSPHGFSKRSASPCRMNPGARLGAFGPTLRNISLQNQLAKGPNMVPATRSKSKHAGGMIGFGAR